jgi:mono/diheme cytochrome c family protein
MGPLRLKRKGSRRWNPSIWQMEEWRDGGFLPIPTVDRKSRFSIATGWAVSTVACALLTSTGLTGCRSPEALTPQQAEGKHLYDVRCAHCHEDNDLNLKKVPPDLHGVFTRTTLPSGAPATDAQVRFVVLAGKGMMPSFAGRFTNDQMAALLAYLHTGLR